MIEGEKVGSMLGGKEEERKNDREKGGKVDNIEFVAHKWRRYNAA